MKRSIYKVPGGKLLKVALDNQGDIITNIQITGDFFLYPEESLALIENEIKDKKIDDIESALTRLLKEKNIELFGFSVGDLITTIKQATQDG